MTKKSKPQKNWREIIKDYNEDAMTIGEENELFYDKAITGIGRVHGGHHVFVYSYELLVKVLAEHMWSCKAYDTEDACWEAAMDWTDSHILDSYVGPDTPFIAVVDEHSDDVVDEHSDE